MKLTLICHTAKPRRFPATPVVEHVTFSVLPAEGDPVTGAMSLDITDPKLHGTFQPGNQVTLNLTKTPAKPDK